MAEPLSRQNILDVAMTLVDEEGIDGLTMRALGKRLGVEAPSLYKHVANKDEILDGLCSEVFSSVGVEGVEGTWEEMLRAYARNYRAALLSHPNLTSTVATRPVLTHNGMTMVELALGLIIDVGFDPESARRLLNIIVGTITGLALNEIGSVELGGPNSERVIAFRNSLPPEQFPMTSQTVVSTPADHQAEFEMTLDILVDGLTADLVRRGVVQPSPTAAS